MTIKPSTNLPKTVRSTKGLRDALFDEMDALREGKTTPHISSAMSKLAVQIINSVRLEIEYQKHVASTPEHDTALNLSPILLGRAA